MSSHTEPQGRKASVSVSRDDQPLVSIIVPAYNTAAFISDAIESALAQTYRPIEIIVVDDGSTDDSLSIAKDYSARNPGLIRTLTQENAGACAARNHGLRESKGEFIKFLDADDVLTPMAVASQLEAIEENADVIPFGRIVSCDSALTPKGGVRVDRNADAVLSEDMGCRVAWLLENNIQTARPLHPRAWLERVGGFDEQLLRAQEYDLHLRLALKGARFKAVDEVGVLLRDHDDPHRITNTGPSLKTDLPKRNVHPNIYPLILEAFGSELPGPIRQVRARRSWRVLRTRIQDGDLVAARRAAQEGRGLDPTFQEVPGAAVRLLYRSLGPLTAERVRAFGKRVLRG